MKARYLTSIFFFLFTGSLFSQQIKLNKILDGLTNGWGLITGMVQDPQGYIWFTTVNRGLCRYDGTQVKTYINDPGNTNSLANNTGHTSCIAIDKDGKIWIGMFVAGLDRFDPVTKKFTHFRHDPSVATSLSNDTVLSILVDHADNLWIGTYDGLNILQKKTGRFIHYVHKSNDGSSLSYNHVSVLYEDRKGIIWAGCGNSLLPGSERPEDGGLNRFDQATGKFTRYLHHDDQPGSISNNKVGAIFEDSRNNFWIGTKGDGLQILDRTSGEFTHFSYDPHNPEKLSRPPLYHGRSSLSDLNQITFISEDLTGAIWIGTFLEGMNRYDPLTKKIAHYGYILQNEKYVKADTASGFVESNSNTSLMGMTTKDGLFWICSAQGNIYNINLYNKTIPYHDIGTEANSFYEQSDSLLFVATDNGLLVINRKTTKEKKMMHDPRNLKTVTDSALSSLRADAHDHLWIGSQHNGIDKLDLNTNQITRYKHGPKDDLSLANDSIYCLLVDHKQDLWAGTQFDGLDKMDKQTGHFSHYRHSDNDTNSLSNDVVNCISEDKKNSIWVGTGFGLNRLDMTSNIFHHYLQTSTILSLCVDASGTVWAGVPGGLYRFSVAANSFVLFSAPNLPVEIKGVVHILEDKKGNLWLSTHTAILKINEERNAIRIYGEAYGVHPNNFYIGDNFKAQDGELFIGDDRGFYSFFPDHMKDEGIAPEINFTIFKLGNQEILPESGGILKLPLWQTTGISLNYNQNVFSFDFLAIHYTNPGAENYRFMLENYNNEWHDIGVDHKAFFFNVPPGSYIFKVRATNSDGVSAEKSIAIHISPPWWRRWWAYTLFGIILIGSIWGLVYYRSSQLRRENQALEQKVEKRTEELKHSLENLKSTQAQLIQSEKMASLGELTAGIAHEIQNPLNFVNNFSEVNKELIGEMKLEISKGNLEGIEAIAVNIEDNEDKIIHHGRRADSIVKGMLQHSRAGSGQKEPTDINALINEWFRLSYHGLMARDPQDSANNSFMASVQTDFDSKLEKINIVPQDMGRVMLNLFNNAFYSVHQKGKQPLQGYEPLVKASTKMAGNKLEIRIRDNGMGITQKNIEKIYQPFFTTKPTGQGTGLGLSLCYDIITKEHGGTIDVDSVEGEYAEFIIRLPLN